MVSLSFLALGFASVLLTAVPPTRSYPTPGLLMDIPSAKTGQQLYIGIGSGAANLAPPLPLGTPNTGRQHKRESKRAATKKCKIYQYKLYHSVLSPVRAGASVWDSHRFMSGLVNASK